MTDISHTSPARPVSLKGFIAWRRRHPNVFIFLIAAIIYLGVSKAILMGAGNPDVRVRIDLSDFMTTPVMVKVHVAAAVLTFGIGVLLMAGLKGNKVHRVLGYTWVVTMGLTAASSFLLTSLSDGSFSLIHGLSAWTLIALPFGIAAARRRDIRKHAKNMTGMFTGGMLIAGLFSFLPGRTMWSIFFAA